VTFSLDNNKKTSISCLAMGLSVYLAKFSVTFEGVMA